jgi:poly(A) polymerase
MAQTVDPSPPGLLTGAGFSVILRGFSAIDRYLEKPPLPFIFIETDAGLQDLARIFGELRFPGVELADAAVTEGGSDYYFRCLDGEERAGPQGGALCRAQGSALLSFGLDWGTGRFLDPYGVYPLLREFRGRPFTGTEADTWKKASDTGDTVKFAAIIPARLPADAALVLARYDPQTEVGTAEWPVGLPFGPEEQRILLMGLLLSQKPEKGLQFLKNSGFVDEFWPELAHLDDVDHSKEFHPEGNVWNHTLETFQHRKPLAGGGYDLRLSLGLLLHDIGKPLAEASGARRFDGHAELGARAASRFLERLGFDQSLRDDIYYLVKNHMLPAALKRLPLTRTQEIMESSLFPTLMELYRCDESSSFKGLDGYYENSSAYQAYLRYRRNPYRSADGKILGKGRGR